MVMDALAESVHFFSLSNGFRSKRASLCVQAQRSNRKTNWNSQKDLNNRMNILARNEMLDATVQQHCLHQTKDISPSCDTLSDLMLSFASNGLVLPAQTIWNEIIYSSYLPSFKVVSNLMYAYGRMGYFDEMIQVLHDVTSRDFKQCREIYAIAISYLGKEGQLEMMETVMKEMVSKGFKVDSLTANTFVKYYSIFGSIADMEASYYRLKRSGILIEEETIRAVTLAYANKGSFYKLGEFVRHVGLGRKNVGNLLWNILLLSYAVNFKMKSLQREFIQMVDAGFVPDLTTFNIRALAFSRMCMFWDLHLSIEHMKSEKVVPDLVTYGCIIDAYISRGLGRNFSFVLGKLNKDSTPVVLTDDLVFELFGKGDFHSTSEMLLQSSKNEELTYLKLVRVYLKKKYRSNQVFWNY